MMRIPLCKIKNGVRQVPSISERMADFEQELLKLILDQRERWKDDKPTLGHLNKFYYFLNERIIDSYIKINDNQILSLEQRYEVIEAVAEQFLPFIAADNLFKEFIDNYARRTDLNERTTFIFKNYPKLFFYDEHYQNLGHVLYEKVNIQSGMPRQISPGSCVHTLLSCCKNFLAHYLNQIYEKNPNCDQGDVQRNLCKLAMQQTLPVAARYGKLWAFASKFRKENKETIKEFAATLKKEAGAIAKTKPSGQDEDKFWENYAESLIYLLREITNEYFGIFQKERTFNGLVSPVADV